MLPPAAFEIAGETVRRRGRMARSNLLASLDFPTGVVSDLFLHRRSSGDDYPSADMRFTVRRTIYFGERQVN
jgi:hypothetical protein